MAHTVNSPLKSWPGSFTLPDPDEFNRSHWDTYEKGENRPKRESYSMIHRCCYAGLELVAAHGKWDMQVVTVNEATGEERAEPLSLSEVRSWEDDPDAERVRLVSFIGREMYYYIENITNPKE